MPVKDTETALARLVLDRPTLTAIAREAGVSVSYVSHIARGRKPPSPAVMAAAVRVLRLPVSEVFPAHEIGTDEATTDTE